MTFERSDWKMVLVQQIIFRLVNGILNAFIFLQEQFYKNLWLNFAQNLRTN